jgi:hypothetical protein
LPISAGSHLLVQTLTFTRKLHSRAADDSSSRVNNRPLDGSDQLLNGQLLAG